MGVLGLLVSCGLGTRLFGGSLTGDWDRFLFRSPFGLELEVGCLGGVDVASATASSGTESGISRKMSLAGSYAAEERRLAGGGSLEPLIAASKAAFARNGNCYTVE
jgi:hypothetical protein